jgi:hypothetical protein
VRRKTQDEKIFNSKADVTIFINPLYDGIRHQQ